MLTGRSNLALAVAAAETFLGDPVDPRRGRRRPLPGRFERAAEAPLEIWDGAHNLDGVGWLLPRLPDRRYVVVASILRDKDADGHARGALGARRYARRDRVVERPARLSADELATLGRSMVPENGDGGRTPAPRSRAHAIARRRTARSW